VVWGRDESSPSARIRSSATIIRWFGGDNRVGCSPTRCCGRVPRVPRARHDPGSRRAPRRSDFRWEPVSPRSRRPWRRSKNAPRRFNVARSNPSRRGSRPPTPSRSSARRRSNCGAGRSPTSFGLATRSPGPANDSATTWQRW
jgi:hypothetical protein